MNRNPIGIIIVLAALAGGWYWFSTSSATAPPESQTAAPTDTAPAATTSSTDVTVVYTDQGFSPASVTIAQGETVTWINQSSKDMWVASAMHPTHMAYDGTALADHCTVGVGTSFDACHVFSPTSSYSFTFDKAGTWKYHDHIDASKFGTVIVTVAQ